MMGTMNFAAPPVAATAILPAGIVWLSGAVAPTDGVAGTGVGVAGPGSRYTNTTTNIEYRQNGTIADVLWQAIHAP